MSKICHLYLILDHLIWASTCFHQILLTDLGKLILALGVLLGCGISYTAVYIWTSMSRQSSHHQLIRLSSKKGMNCYSHLFTSYAFHKYGFLFFSFSLCISILVRTITCLYCCRLYRAYEKLFASMHDKGIGPHKTQFRRDENYGNKSHLIVCLVFGLKCLIF